MAEFQCFLEHFLKYNKDFRAMYGELEQKEKRCLEDIRKKAQIYSADNNTKAEVEGLCYQDRKTFDKFLEKEKKNYVTKGIEICLKSLEHEKVEDLPAKTKECVKFYQNGILLFQDQAMQKIRNILYRYSFENL